MVHDDYDVIMDQLKVLFGYISMMIKTHSNLLWKQKK